MKKPILLIAFILFGLTNLKASHFLGSYFEYRIDSAKLELEVRLHVVLKTGAMAFDRNSVTLDFPGLGGQKLWYDGAAPVHHPIGDASCPVGSYYEKVYTGIVDLNSGYLSRQSPNTFSVQLLCCTDSAVNIPTGTAFYLEFTITPQIDNNRNWYYPDFDNIGSNPKMVQAAYPDIRNYINFGLKFMPIGADSTRFQLQSVFRGPGIPAQYRAGFSAITPLPDKSEDTANGHNIFFPAQRIISSETKTGINFEGKYFIGLRNTYFRNGLPFLSDDAVALVYQYARDTSFTDTLKTIVEQVGQAPSLPTQSQQLFFDADHLESIQLDVSAFASIGDSIKLLRTNLSVDTNTLNLPSVSNFSLPSITSLNPGQSPSAQDTGRWRIEFTPQKDNFLFGPKSYILEAFFSHQDCNGYIARLRVRIDLNDYAFVNRNNSINDTFYYCVNRPPVLESQNFLAGTHFWYPSTFVQDSSTARAVIVPPVSGWLYLVLQDGTAQDSIYISPQSIRSIVPLNRTSSETITSALNSVSIPPNWRVSNLINVQTKFDTLPILGSGTYAYSIRRKQHECPLNSDTLTVYEDFLWGSSITPDSTFVKKVHKTTSRGDRFSVDLRMANDTRIVEKIFFFGFSNPNHSQPLSLKLFVNSSSGYQDSIEYQITNQSYVEFPVNLELNPTNSASLVVELEQGLSYQYLESNQVFFDINALRFRMLRNGPIDSVSLPNNLFLPFGFRYKGEIGLSELATKPYELYPNPGKDRFYLDWRLSSGANIELYNANGKLMNSIEVTEGLNTLNLGLIPGLYILKFPTELGLEHAKLMVK